MALEDQVAQLSQNVGNLVNLVSTQANNWNAMVQNEINILQQWQQNAIKGYPAWNLFANARLDKVNSDNTPKGVYYSANNVSLTAAVMNETSGGVYSTAGNFLRLQLSVADQTKYAYGSVSGIIGVFPSVFPKFPANAPLQRMTVGFDYRIISVSGKCTIYPGADDGGSISLNATSWTTASRTWATGKYSLFYIYLNEPTATITVDFRNIYLNLGDANFYTLGIQQLYDLSI